MAFFVRGRLLPLLALAALGLLCASAQAADPKHRFLGKKEKVRKNNLTEEVIYFAVAYDGAMKPEVCKKVFNNALKEAKAGKFYYSSSDYTTDKKPRKGGSLIYLFGYHSLTTGKGGWIATFPGLKSSNGQYGSCEFLTSDGKRDRTNGERSQQWPVRNKQSVYAIFKSDRAGGITFRLILTVTR